MSTNEGSQAVDFCVCTFQPAILKGSVCRENISLPLLLSLQCIQGFLNHRRKTLQETSTEHEMYLKNKKKNKKNSSPSSLSEFTVVTMVEE